MKFKLLILLGGIVLFPLVAYGQFHTIVDSTRLQSHRIVKQRKRKVNVEIEPKGNEKEAPRVEEKKEGLRVDTSAVRRWVKNPTYKLEQRLNVCLPLDFLRLSSPYGNRLDPFTQKMAFHDGIDLACNGENVYAMLPAVVKEVHRGAKGYGNYVVLHHGEIECLYAHLKEITVREKEVINAGTIVGISGNSGKSTAPHLHIRLRHRGKSVDPMPFIVFLKQHIQRLGEEIGISKEENHVILSNHLTLDNVYKEIVKVGLRYPAIVLSQAILETGHFSSRVCNEYNNLFGLRKRNGEYFQFQRWEDSVVAYLRYVQYKYKGGDYFAFLEQIGYAEDRAYTLKLRLVAESIKHKARS